MGPAPARLLPAGELSADATIILEITFLKSTLRTRSSRPCSELTLWSSRGFKGVRRPMIEEVAAECATPPCRAARVLRGPVVRLSSFHWRTERLQRAINARLSSATGRPSCNWISGGQSRSSNGCLRYIVAMSSPARAKRGWSSLRSQAIGEWGRDDVCPGRPLDPHIGLAAPRKHVLFRSCLAQLTRLISVAPFVKQTLSRRSIRTLLMIYLGQVEPDAAVRSRNHRPRRLASSRADVPRNGAQGALSRQPARHPPGVRAVAAQLPDVNRSTAARHLRA